MSWRSSRTLCVLAISGLWDPFSSRVVNVGVRDSTYVLDGLLYHETDLRIEEHYTDTAGFTDHVFALMQLLGFRFAPRIRDLGDTKLYVPGAPAAYPALRPLIGGTLNIKQIQQHWDEILRPAASIKHGKTKARHAMRWRAPYSSGASARSVTAASSSSAIAPAA